MRITEKKSTLRKIGKSSRENLEPAKYRLTIRTLNIILLCMNMNKKIIKRSVSELKKILRHRFRKGLELYLFGSVARGQFGPESDIDILALLPDGDDMNLKKEIVDLAYDIELKYNIIFGIVVCSTEFWRSEKAAVMPFHRNLQKEALRI